MAQASEQTSVYQTESPCKLIPIWSLSDDLLSKIFSYLKPNDRFQLAEVCNRWAGVSRMDWTDIMNLDLNPIPKENVGPIIHLCPKLESITAQDCELNLMSITENLRSELKSFSLYRVSANAGFLSSSENPAHGDLPKAFLRELQQLTHLQELVLSELPLHSLKGMNHFVWDNLPSSLKRLQLDIAVFCHQSGLREGIEEPYQTIDCLILQEESLVPLCASNAAEPKAVARLAAVALFRLRQLRELSLDTLFSNANAACVANNYYANS